MSVFVCTKCLKTFSRKSNLKRHCDETHNDDANSVAARFVCSFADCGRTFKRKHDRDLHESTAHATTKQFACAEHQCNARFTTLEQLLEHMNIIHSITTTTTLSALSTTTTTNSTSSTSTINSSTQKHEREIVSKPSITTTTTKRSSEPTIGERPLKRLVKNDRAKTTFTFEQIIDAANNNRLVRHDNHVDAIIQGVLVGIEDAGNNELVATEHSLRSTTTTNTTSSTTSTTTSTTTSSTTTIANNSQQRSSISVVDNIHDRCQQHNCIMPLNRMMFADNENDDDSKLEQSNDELMTMKHVHGVDCGHMKLIHESHNDCLVRCCCCWLLN